MLPRATSKSTPRSASTSLNDFSRPFTRIAGSCTGMVVIAHLVLSLSAYGVDFASQSKYAVYTCQAMSDVTATKHARGRPGLTREVSWPVRWRSGRPKASRRSACGASRKSSALRPWPSTATFATSRI